MIGFGATYFDLRVKKRNIVLDRSATTTVLINKLGLLKSHDFGGCRHVRERCPRRELNESVFSEASGRVKLRTEPSEVQSRIGGGKRSAWIIGQRRRVHK